jgi:hypothetical protein
VVGPDKLVFGMQVNAEIHVGTRSVLEYLLSPVQKIAHKRDRGVEPEPIKGINSYLR